MENPTQNILGPFWDHEVLAFSPQSNRSHRSADLTLYRLRIRVNINGQMRLGGVDDIERELDGTIEGNEDNPSRHRTRLHEFIGVIQITDRDSLSPRGVAILQKHHARLDTLDSGGRLYITVKCVYHRYDVRPFGANTGTRITSIAGPVGYPHYLTYRVVSHELPTWIRCRQFRERNWWLLFVREYFKARNTVPKSKRKIEGIVRFYREEYPFHPSGVVPASEGPPKHVSRGEVYTQLAKHALFIKSKLEGQKPQPMFPHLWDDLWASYAQSSAYDEEMASDTEDGSEGSESESESEADVLESPRYHAQTPSSRSDNWGGVETDQFPSFATPDDQTDAMSVQALETDFSALRIAPKPVDSRGYLVYKPKWSANYTYQCDFHALVPANRLRPGTACDFQIDLLKMTPEMIETLPSAEFKRIIRERRTLITGRAMPELLAALLDEHLKAHELAQSGMRGIEAGQYKVQFQFVRSVSLVQRDLSDSLRNRYDADTNGVTYTWSAAKDLTA